MSVARGVRQRKIYGQARTASVAAGCAGVYLCWGVRTHGVAAAFGWRGAGRNGHAVIARARGRGGWPGKSSTGCHLQWVPRLRSPPGIP